MSERKRPNSRRNLDIAIERMVEGRGDPLRTRAALAAAIVAQMLPDGVVENASDIDYALVRRTCVHLFAYRQLQKWPPVIVGGET